LIEPKEYKGFNLAEWGEIAVTYNKEGALFLQNFKFVCLNKQAHNDFYPDPYLILCIELELEGSGNSKEVAMRDLYQLLDVYFNRVREIYKNPEEYVSAITANFIQQNPWKQFFIRIYKQAQKLA
jgi:hypothetical protein